MGQGGTAVLWVEETTCIKLCPVCLCSSAQVLRRAMGLAAERSARYCCLLADPPMLPLMLSLPLRGLPSLRRRPRLR